MAPAPPLDEKRLQAYYDTAAKYHADPVPTPLDRKAAIDFVNAKANQATPTEKMRKLVRLAVFYDLRETAGAFSAVLTGNESQPDEIVRSALCLSALAWIGNPGQQVDPQQYYRALQDRADVDLHRNVTLEVVEAFGPREGTGPHRQWIRSAIAVLQARLGQEQANRNIAGAKLMQEKINSLTEYLNVQLVFVDRAFALRQRIEAMAPMSQQIAPLAGYSLSIMIDSTPQLSYWASMQLLRLDATFRAQIGREFYAVGSARTGADLSASLVRARALRAAEYFGYPLPEQDRAWLAGQPDAGTDPLVLRPRYYMS